MDETVVADLEALATGLADPDADLDALDVLEARVLAARDAALVPALEAHLAAAAEARGWYARAVLARILVRTAGRAALPALLRAHARDLGDDQDSLTTELTCLAEEDPASARALLLPWTLDPDPELRRTAFWLLDHVRHASDVERLVRAAADPDEGVRRTVAGALTGHCGTDPRAVVVLTGLLSDASPRVRISALSSLGFARRPETLPAIRRLADDADETVRRWVTIALARFPAGGVN
ncbi:HEAT repeat domain-containing protein [Actinacidiphila glaucinigra]|uniref:HEAT repeat domain-containing protein n=1 Tax=Actinacidiphila glaucinigra TaxID=235986 RepID=UPI002DD84903|nr:HEAT repeat domain-containing protein [Actinacidiphila glaucinigra]WSD59761.1 HEAT repeat domain-containing protein [Actinacidiphila glaucinigra]